MAGIPDSDPRLRAALQRHLDLRTARLSLERRAGEAKREEAEAHGALLALLAARDLRSAALPGIGRVSMRERRRYRIEDPERFLSFALRAMREAESMGLPLSRWCPLTQGIARTRVDGWLRDHLPLGAEGPSAEAVSAFLEENGAGVETDWVLSVSEERRE